MDLRNGAPFWAIHEGRLGIYPALEADLEADVVVIGGGITGALVADRLSLDGHRCVVLDKRDVGWGSTMGSTAMLQYEIDVSLTDLVAKIGEADAVAAYRLCASAIDLLDRLTGTLPDRCGFTRCRSLYLSRQETERGEFEVECGWRRRAGLEVRLLDKGGLFERYGLDRPSAILSQTAARVEPYRLTHVLLKRACLAGCRVFDRTGVTSVNADAVGGRLWRVETDRGAAVRCNRVVFCTGFESSRLLRERIVRLISTYAVATEPVPDVPRPLDWLEDHLVWESGESYFYMRAGPDGRVLMGGEDTPFKSDSENDQNLCRQTDVLTAKCGHLLSRPVEAAYSWAGVFGRTEDGLGYFGQSPEMPGIDWVLGFGGNGITFSAVMAEMLANEYRTGKPDPLARLFRFGRL